MRTSLPNAGEVFSEYADIVVGEDGIIESFARLFFFEIDFEDPFVTLPLSGVELDVGEAGIESRFLDLDLAFLELAFWVSLSPAAREGSVSTLFLEDDLRFEDLLRLFAFLLSSASACFPAKALLFRPPLLSLRSDKAWTSSQEFDLFTFAFESSKSPSNNNLLSEEVVILFSFLSETRRRSDKVFSIKDLRGFSAPGESDLDDMRRSDLALDIEGLLDFLSLLLSDGEDDLEDICLAFAFGDDDRDLMFRSDFAVPMVARLTFFSSLEAALGDLVSGSM